VTRVKQSSTPCISYVVEGQCLPKIDDNVDNALGLVVLYQFLMKTRTNELQRQLECAVFSPNSLACYLQPMSRYCNEIPANYQRGRRERADQSSPTSRSVRQSQSSAACMRRYRDTIRVAPAVFIGDLLLCYLANQSAKRTSTDVHAYKPKTQSLSPGSSLVATELRRLLIQHAVEHLTSCHVTMSRDFINYPQMGVITTDIEALYAFHRGEYERCLEMTSRLDIASRLEAEKIDCLFLPMCGNMTPLLDDNLASIAAVAALMQQSGGNTQKTVIHVTQLTLSLYLLVESKMKLKHPVTSLIDHLRLIVVLNSKYKAVRDKFCDQAMHDEIRRYLSLVESECKKVSGPQAMFDELGFTALRQSLEKTLSDKPATYDMLLLSFLYRRVNLYIRKELRSIENNFNKLGNA